MFFKKEKDYSLLVFGLISIGVILSVCVLLVIFFTKAGKGELKNNSNVVNILEKAGDELVLQKYSQGVDLLIKDLESKEDLKEIYGEVEEFFFKVRVPKEKMQDHLKLFLSFDALQKNKGSKEEVMNILKKLIEKNEKTIN